MIYAHIIYAATHRCIIYAYMKGRCVCVLCYDIYSVVRRWIVTHTKDERKTLRCLCERFAAVGATPEF